MSKLAFKPNGSPSAEPSSSSFKDQLRTLVDDKREQVALANALGNRFLSQQVELEDRIQQIDDASMYDADTEALRVKLADLANTINSWEVEDQQTWSAALSMGKRVSSFPKPQFTRS